MTLQSIVMLVAAMPVLAAVVCRLNEFERRSMSIAVAVITWAVGCWVAGALLWSFSGPPGPLSWTAIATGWLWIMGTWAFRPLRAEANR